tara:strand:+ start:193854 stop:194906 length:1053 start_codon:yes stop_codon:yes gene_type:complete
MNRKVFLTRLTKWEHWPSFMFYIPLIPFYLWNVIKVKNPIFFLAANPAIKYSGSGTESKYKTVLQIPYPYRPKTIFVAANENTAAVKNKIAESKINFPLIAKPDIGFRGLLVKKIDTLEILENYIIKNNVDLIIQEFVAYENECGIFYSRIPNQKKGKITSITLKKFLTITGDGSSTLSELILKDERAYLYVDLLQNIHGANMQTVLKNEEARILTVIGNHSKGTQFINGNDLIDEELERFFDTLNNQIEGWFYGRLDIKYDTLEKLKQGADFKILEINGIIAEPTHIYDPTNASYFDALKSLKNHWKILAKIALINHHKFNVPYPKLGPYLKEIAWLRSYSKKLKRLNK